MLTNGITKWMTHICVVGEENHKIVTHICVVGEEKHTIVTHICVIREEKQQICAQFCVTGTECIKWPDPLTPWPRGVDVGQHVYKMNWPGDPVTWMWVNTCITWPTPWPRNPVAPWPRDVDVGQHLYKWLDCHVTVTTTCTCWSWNRN
jgi:hypothetical protein